MSYNTSNKPVLLSGGQRIIGLDYLRISLAVLVFLFHSHSHVLKCDYGVLNGFVSMGAIAMTGFFLLSGYALNLSNKNFENARDVKKFYIKRLIAILPLYYAYAAINVAINIFRNGTTAAIEELILFPTEFLGIQSVFASLFPYSHNGGSWFISCILICYLLYPLLQIISRKSVLHKKRLSFPGQGAYSSLQVEVLSLSRTQDKTGFLKTKSGNLPADLS